MPRRARRPALRGQAAAALVARRQGHHKLVRDGSWARSAACAPPSCRLRGRPGGPSAVAVPVDLAGGGIAIDTGYHLVDWRGSSSARSTRSRRSSPSSPTACVGADAVGNRGGTVGGSTAPESDRRRRDAAAALVTFEGGAYGVSRPAAWRSGSGCRSSSRFGSLGSAEWDLGGRTSSVRACPATCRHSGSGGSRQPGHLGRRAADRRHRRDSIGFLVNARWAELLDAIGDGRRGSADSATASATAPSSMRLRRCGKGDDPGRAAGPTKATPMEERRRPSIGIAPRRRSCPEPGPPGRSPHRVREAVRPRRVVAGRRPGRGRGATPYPLFMTRPRARASGTSTATSSSTSTLFRRRPAGAQRPEHQRRGARYGRARRRSRPPTHSRSSWLNG